MTPSAGSKLYQAARNISGDADAEEIDDGDDEEEEDDEDDEEEGDDDEDIILQDNSPPRPAQAQPSGTY